MKRLIEEMIRKKWDKEWNEYEEGKHSKECLTGNDNNKAKKLLELSRFEVSRYVTLITGHGNLAYFLSKLEPGVNPVCRFCNERNETFIHLTECPRLREYQVDCFLGENRAWEWSHENILKFSYCRAVDDALAELEMGDYSFLSNSTVTDSEDSFRYSQPEPD